MDVIISEWMGYALLYESMLDSVLVARDRFLNIDAGGVMAPSQCRMVLSMCDPEVLIKQRVGFWADVYGFDMGVMVGNAYEEAIIDYIPKDSILTSQCVVKVGSLMFNFCNISLVYVGSEPSDDHVEGIIIFFPIYFERH